jgi:hypothetical protein
MRTIFRTSFRSTRGLLLALVLTFALGGAAYAITSSTPPDFAMTPATTSATTTLGGAAGYGINLQALGGFSDNVTLSVSNLPANSSATFGTNPSFVDPSLASGTTLWINTTSSTPVGTDSNIILTATNSSGTITHTATLSLTVAQSGTPDYTIEVTPSTQYISAGGSVTYNVKTVASNGFTGSIMLSAKTVPGAVALGWNGAPPTTAQNPSVTVPAGGSATLTVTTASTNPPGSYAVTVTGTSGSVSHTSAATLDIDLFSATGTLTTTLYPGNSAVPIPATLTDPYNYNVTVTGLAASVKTDGNGTVIDGRTSKAATGCLASWFKFVPSSISSTNTVTLPAGGSVTPPSSLDPMVSMADPLVNQNACQGVQLQFNIVGTAQK